jgi:hypothetical protein
MIGSFGQEGARQANDCTFNVGNIPFTNTPLKIHYFLVLMTGYQVFTAWQQVFDPWWYPV